MKAYRIFTVLACIASLNAHAAPSIAILSDLDDTVKVSNAPNFLDLTWRALFSERAFAGMSMLYTEMNAANEARTGKTEKTYFVTGTGTWLEGIVQDFLKENQFSSDYELFLREWFSGKSTETFKDEVIPQILDQKITENVILIGDDGAKDPEVYERIQQKYGSRVSGIYIHKIRGRNVPTGQVTYDTAMDIALYELTEGRLPVQSVLRVGSAIISNAENIEWVMHFYYCPMPGRQRVSDTLKDKVLTYDPSGVALTLASMIEEKIEQICLQRSYQQISARGR